MVNICQLLLEVQRVLEGLCCPGSRYRHEAREGTALQLSERTNKFKDSDNIVICFSCWTLICLIQHIFNRHFQMNFMNSYRES